VRKKQFVVRKCTMKTTWDRRGRRGGGIVIDIKKSIQCEELSLKNSHKQIES